MTDATIAQITIPGYCYAERALHREEVGIFSKREWRLLENIEYVNLSCGVFFPYTPFKKHNEQSFRKLTKKIFEERGIHSEQSTFYMNVSYDQVESSKKASIGDKITFGETRYTSPDANETRNGLNNSTVFEIVNNEKLHAVALPSQIFGVPLYIFPTDSVFQITNIRFEDWNCTERLACRKIYPNVKVITLECI